MIIGKDIWKNYGSSSILKGIDIEIHPGKITVLIGPSGCGKTTLLKSLSLIENPSSGEVCIDSECYSFPNQKKVRGQFDFNETQTLGIVFQNLDLIPHWTNKQNILKPLGKSKIDNHLEKMETLIALFGIENLIDKLPHQCSQGEQQRVAFVRAIMLKPKYLFLDEITSALDPELIAVLFRYLLQLKNNGTGIMIITHFLLFAQNVADRVIFLKSGKIYEEGDNNIMHKPQTKELTEFLNSVKGIILK